MFYRFNIDKDTEDEKLLELIQKGNKEAFSIIYTRFHRQLYILAFTYLKNKEMAEDAVQHVFAKLWEFHKDLSVKVSLRNYLYTITKNYILNIIRNQNLAIKKNYEIAQETEHYEDNLFEIIEKKELTNIFNKALNLLPEQKKQVCLLKFEEKLSNQEIADKMQISINTVKTHYAQSVKILRVHISRMLIIVIIVILF